MSIIRRLFGKRSSGDSDYRRLIDQSMEELRLKTSAHDAAWRIGEARWDVDQDSGTLVFTRPDGVKATCPVQFVGSYDTRTRTWLWASENRSIDPPLQDHARRTRELGRRPGFERLVPAKLECEESEAWEFTALACKVCGAQGAYRGPAGPLLVFMTFGKVRLGQ